MRFHIITIFPKAFDSYLRESIVGRAIKNKLVKVKFYDPRDFVKASKNNYRPVDDRPYGGGPGMVMRPEPVIKAVARALSGAKSKSRQFLIVNFIPSAERFTNSLARSISRKYTDVILICGRYEGIDARVDRVFKTKKISIGDYVLTGGEIPALTVIDCVSRQIPGVLGKRESLEEERVSTSEMYTRPEVLEWPRRGPGRRRYLVPKILLSGHRAKIEEWKKKKR